MNCILAWLGPRQFEYLDGVEPHLANKCIAAVALGAGDAGEQHPAEPVQLGIAAQMTIGTAMVASTNLGVIAVS